MSYEYCCCDERAQYAEGFRFADGDAGEGNLYVTRNSWSRGKSFLFEKNRLNWFVELPPAETPSGGTQDQPGRSDTGDGFIRVSDQSNDVLWVHARASSVADARTWSKIDLSTVASPTLIGSWKEENDAGGTDDYTRPYEFEEAYSNDSQDNPIPMRSCFGDDVIYFQERVDVAELYDEHGPIRWVDPENFVWRSDAYFQLNDSDYEIIGITRSWPAKAVVKRVEITATTTLSTMATVAEEVTLEIGTIDLPTTAPTNYPTTLDVADFEAELTRVYTNGSTGGSDANVSLAAQYINKLANQSKVYDYDDGTNGLVYSILAAEDADVAHDDTPGSVTWNVNYPWGTLSKVADDWDDGGTGYIGFDSTNEGLEYVAIWTNSGGKALCIDAGGDGSTTSGNGYRVDISSGSISRTITDMLPTGIDAIVRQYRVQFAPCTTLEIGGNESLRMYLAGRIFVLRYEVWEKADEWKINNPNVSSQHSQSDLWATYQAPWGDSDDASNRYGLPAYQVSSFAATEVRIDSVFDINVEVGESPKGMGDVSTIDGDPWIPPHEWVFTQPDDPIAFIGSVSSSSTDGNHTVVVPNYVIDTDWCALVSFSLGNADLISPLPGGHSWNGVLTAISASGPRLYIHVAEGMVSGDVLSVKLSATTEPSVVVLAWFRNTDTGINMLTSVKDEDEHPMTIPEVANDAETFVIHGCLAYGDGGDFSVEPTGDTLVEIDAGLANGAAPEELHAIVKMFTINEDNTAGELTYEHNDADTLCGFQSAVNHK